MPWSWSLLVAVLVVGSTVVAGLGRALERERTRLVASVRAVSALAAAHRGLAAAHQGLAAAHGGPAEDLPRGRPN